ncbi:MAG: type II secretion system F family protein [Betaproteobacteria bacterium]|nr:MAG: type II secretion system F family protein [Betaproteobacteria bacterium]
MATAAAVAKVKEVTYLWEGKDKSGKVIKGQMRAGGQAVVTVTLRRQGIIVSKVHKQRLGRGGKVSDKDVSLFTRQMATMMKAGVPLLQSFDIVGKGHANPAVARLLMGIKTDVETGSSLASAFRKYPLHFDALYCNLVAAGEQAGILETLLERLATYKEKILGIKSKIKAALFYPIAIIVVAFIITAVIMIFVIPAFKEVFTSFGADLPAPTLFVMGVSNFFVNYWYIIFPAVIGGTWVLKVPVFGDLIKKSTIARWTRTLSIMFAAGVPLVEALDSVGGASGNYVYAVATKEIQRKVSTGTSLTASMQESNVFPNMVVQMVSIGEESGALDAMLGKVADFFEAEVDDAVDALTSLMEPMIMVVLGVLIGGMVIAMYLPIFKIGQAV